MVLFYLNRFGQKLTKMCGIAGIYKFGKSTVDFNEIKKFTDTLFHRGPDGAGYELLNNNLLGLGHRRLSILDLSELGRQPMVFANRYWIIFNGEIFNFIELKEELLQKGISFKTDTDTEVILAAYQIWGKNAFLKFNGMWALAIWDDKEKKLILCRDRFGIKPLHYVFKQNNFFAFASETIAFNELKDFSKKINNDRLLFAIHNPSNLESTGETIYDDIKQLLPGHLIEIDHKYNLQQSCWWNTSEYITINNSNFSKQKEDFFNLFENACKIRLRSDVPIASALSGGLDSSSVFSMINYISKNNHTFNRTPNSWKKAVVATFPNTEIDEKIFADQVVNFLNAEAIYTKPNYQNLPEDILKTTKLFDSISGTPIISVTDVYKAMQLNGIKVSLDGHGGDELLFGYKSSIYDLFDYYLTNGNFLKAEEIATTYSLMVEPNNISKTKEKLLQIIQNHKNRSIFSKLKTRIFDKQNTKKNQKFLNGDYWFNDQKYTNLQQHHKFNSHYPEQLLWEDFFIKHIPYNLRDFDRGAMQHGIEIRMPFMDYRLVCFCFGLPIESKVQKGYTKYILRESMKKMLPETIRLRTNKIGLGAPTSHWFNNQLNEFICDEVSSVSFTNTNIWNARVIKEEVIKRCKEKSWDNFSANKFWNVLNAHIIINK